jgi:hypothetical protein
MAAGSVVAQVVVVASLSFFQTGLPSLKGTTNGAAATSIRRYFEAWNERDMEAACEQFSEECVYEDTQYR